MTDMDPFDAEIMGAVDATVAACRAENATLRARVAELEAALRQAEWADDGYCPVCAAYRYYAEPHKPACPIAAALSSPPPHDGEGK